MVSHETLIIFQRAKKEHIQERAYQCIWNNHIMFWQKYYNFTTLSMWVVYKYVVSKNSIVLKDVVLYFHWHDVICWRSYITAKNRLLSHSKVSSWILANNTGEVVAYIWQSVTKLNVVKNVIMPVPNFMNDHMFNLSFYCHIILYWEKVTFYEKLYKQCYPWSPNFLEHFSVLIL